MSETAEAIVCPHCGTRRSGSFRYCTVCGRELPAPTKPKPPTPVPSFAVAPLAPAPRTADPVPAPNPVAASAASSGPRPKATSRPKTGMRWLRWAVPSAAGAVLVIAVVTGLRPTPREISVVVGSDRWVAVDPRGVFGSDREFVVHADGPLRLRSASGRPILAAGAPLSLGAIGAEPLELKSVDGVRTVRLVAR